MKNILVLIAVCSALIVASPAGAQAPTETPTSQVQACERVPSDPPAVFVIDERHRVRIYGFADACGRFGRERVTRMIPVVESACLENEYNDSPRRYHGRDYVGGTFTERMRNFDTVENFCRDFLSWKRERERDQERRARRQARGQ